MTRAVPAGDFDYEPLGERYTRHRRPDPRIATLVTEALGSARTVLNVGAGAGSYEPDDRLVLAVEPSASMRALRPSHRLPAIDATAEQLPFDDDSVDAAMAMVTIHQWGDVDQGLREMRRVSRGPVVVLTFDPDALVEYWLNDYVPEVIETEARRFPAIARIADVLGGSVTITGVPVPLDCTDGFGDAYYGRPEAFLDPDVRASQSGWMLTDPRAVESGLARLRTALSNGEWDAKHGHLRITPARIGAVRLIVAQG